MYTPEQVAFTLAWIAYNGDLLPFGPQVNAALVLATLQERIQTLPPLDGEWRVAWGPALHQPVLGIFNDHMMFVLQNKADEKRYMIVVRGTNPVSVSTWLFQNLVFATTVEWPFGPVSLARIAQGTQSGMDTLLRLKPALTIPGRRRTLPDFLRNEVVRHGQDPIDLTVTGHSLGGVLAGALGVALADTRRDHRGIRNGPWDPAGSSRITTYSFGGPTAGNLDFARHCDDRDDVKAHRLWNTLDVVPHAWNGDMLHAIPSLYEGHCAPDPFLEAACRVAEVVAGPAGYTHPTAGEVSFTGEIQGILPLFGAQALYQHGQAYLEHLQLAHILSVFDILHAFQLISLQTRALMSERKK